MRHSKLITLSGLALAIASNLVISQESSAPKKTIEEVFVTSNKLGTSDMQELPVSAKLMTGEELEDRGVFDFVDFAGSIPSLQFQDLGPGDKEIIVRGVNSSGPSTVGVYFDETPITGSNAQDGGGRSVDIKLIDLETVEVFNGPQGTQYGANSMSGLIRYVPKKPDAYEFSASVDVDASSTEEGGFNSTVSGVVNVPLIEEKLAMRAVAWGVDNEGWIDQPRAIGGENENINNEKTTGGRLMFRFHPTDTLTFDAYYLHQSLDSDGSSRYTPKGTDSYGIDGSPYPSYTPDEDFQNTDLGKSPWEEELDLFSLTASYEADFGQFTLSHNNYKRDISFSFDASPLAFNNGLPVPWGIVQPQERDVTFTEARFSSYLDGPVQFFAGTSMRKEINDWQSYGTVYDENGETRPFAPGPDNDFFSNLDFATLTSTGDVIYQRYVNYELEQQALFGELAYEATDKLTFTAGARYFQSDQKQVEGSIHPTDEGEITVDDPNSDHSKATYKFSVGYQPESDVNFYGLVSQGFRVGGLNNSESIETLDIPASYEPDFLTNYEIGFKTKFNNETVIFNGAMYRIDWEDIQIESTSGSVPYIQNAGTAQIFGMEMSLSAYMFDNYFLEFSGSYADTSLTENQPTEGPVDPDLDLGKKGDKVPNVPSIQAYAALTYTMNFPIGEVDLRGDITHRGSSNIKFDTSGNQAYELDAYSILSLRATLRASHDITASFYIKNLTNERAEYDAVYTEQDPLAVIGAKPRTVGVRLRKDF